MTFNEIISKQSELSSTTGRQIVFALIAVAWSLSKDNQDFHLNLSLVLLIGYLAIDLSQYFFSTIKYRKLEIDYAVAKENWLDEEKDQITENYNIAKYKINKLSYWLFILKFTFIPVAVFSLFITLIQ